MYKFVSASKRSLRAGAGVEFETVTILAAGTPAYGEELHVYANDLNYGLKGDKWLHVTQINNKTVDYWIAVIHRGVVYGELTEEGAKAELPYSITLGDDITYQKVTITGTLKPV